MEQMELKSLESRKWKGYDFNELQFKAMVARTKLEIGKATVLGQYVQMVSSDNAGSQMVHKVDDYMRYATYGLKAYKLGKKIWSMFKSRQ